MVSFESPLIDRLAVFCAEQAKLIAESIRIRDFLRFMFLYIVNDQFIGERFTFQLSPLTFHLKISVEATIFKFINNF